MKIKKNDLKWYVLIYDFNKKKIINYNVITDDIIELINKNIKNATIHDKKSLKDFLAKEFKYKYWSKAEYEVFISDIINATNFEKIDVWKQLEINLDVIVEYINLKYNLKF